MPYDKFIDVVDRSFETWGSQAAIWVKPGSAGTFNPATGLYTGATASSNVSIKAIFTPVSLYYVDNRNVLVGDVEIKISPKGLSSYPVIGDKITRGTISYSIVNTKHIKPGDTTVLLVYHARPD